MHWLALRSPAWGHRKIWALALARGYEVSLSTVYRLMLERGLVHRGAIKPSAASWRKQGGRCSPIRPRAQSRLAEGLLRA